jgi:hypothetical protein
MSKKLNVLIMQAFLNEFHPGAYLVFNLCRTRRYPPSKFGGRIRHDISVDSMGAASIADMALFCDAVNDWLAASPSHVVAVHRYVFL